MGDPGVVPVTSIQDRLASAVGVHRGVDAANRLCEACVDLLPIDAAAISLVFDGVNSATLGASGDDARRYDETQFVVGEGPCLDAVVARSPVMVIDLAEQTVAQRWPVYVPTMLTFDIRGVFAMPVCVAGEYLGALDLFRHRTGSLGADEFEGALVAAELAEMPMLDLLAEDLQTALADLSGDVWNELNTITRTEVSQATGMLVAQLDIGPTEALVRLRAHAYLTGRSATEVARDILDHRLILERE